MSPTCPVTGLSDSDTQDFIVTASSDNGGNIIQYQADWAVGTQPDFSTYITSTNGVFSGGQTLGPFYCDGDNPQTYNVAFRALDDCSPPNLTVFATCMVTVDDCGGTTNMWKYEIDPSRQSLVISSDVPN